MYEIPEKKDENLKFENIDYKIISEDIKNIKACVQLISVNVNEWNLIGIKSNIMAIAMANHTYVGNLCDETEEIKYLIQFPNCEPEFLSKADIDKKLKNLIDPQE
ncbi:hypothetical protein KKC67_01815 [Patescibacteria group bacterium]|nr:hypothetical protein [Patescibacteria group bacterium]MBU0879564.1 hypothetical protein [Patescibacteria group bacterium]MBU0880138.1 hypothetical protein [Patescibacteria group bacterium]MBU0898118.1 hypothetical protein [Patescibacteria group bacterium]MBU1782992.1 hypothetical protein [Patescibacteria group bacterium]